MKTYRDGPASQSFWAVPFQGNSTFEALATDARITDKMRAAVEHAAAGACVMWGIPFEIGEKPAVVVDQPVGVDLAPLRAGWLVFAHTSDLRDLQTSPGGLISPMRGEGRLNEHAADYVVRYEDGSEERIAIRRRYQVGSFTRRWGENCFAAVAFQKPAPTRAAHEQRLSNWGYTQTRVNQNDSFWWTNWLFAWQNPYPEKAILGLRFEPTGAEGGALVVSGISAGVVTEQPLRWLSRRKAVLTLPEELAFQPDLDSQGLLAQIQLDLGAVISAHPRLAYPGDDWEQGYNNQIPARLAREIVIEYTAHPDACFHLWDGRAIPAADVERGQNHPVLQPVTPATQRVRLRVIEKNSGRLVASKLHVHGAAGEYLAPVDRHRIANPAWFEDYSVDFSHRHIHQTTYIPGETSIDLPLGKVYLEISKGFEIRPLRKVVEIGPETEEISVEVEKVLPWREKGWVTADTHVHFLSTGSALLEGAGEDVNVVNLLASQWGELMTNVGDFDGRTTWASSGPEAGEYLVRVGTENRQHVLGHISLLGYNGPIIAPMTTGGADESAIGDPVEILLTEWARLCRQQGGLVVLPHFPNPRAEHAASIVSGDVDALEMTSWGDLYSGISPYSLSDWYRYLNCGYRVAAVGGTDKMSANTAVGTVRTYARIPQGQPFTYPAWMDAVRRAETFVSYGPLLEFMVDGQPMGTRMAMTASGGTVDVNWQANSVTVPISRVELVVNGEIRESVAAGPWQAAGSWQVHVNRSSWLALLVRGGYPDKPEIITAHTSPVMVDVEGSRFLAAADAVTILEQIEGSLAFLDTIGTRAQDRVYKRMRLVLEGAHRALHNRMHQAGYFHQHTGDASH